MISAAAEGCARDFIDTFAGKLNSSSLSRLSRSLASTYEIALAVGTSKALVAERMGEKRAAAPHCALLERPWSDWEPPIISGSSAEPTARAYAFPTSFPRLLAVAYYRHAAGVRAIPRNFIIRDRPDFPALPRPFSRTARSRWSAARAINFDG